MDKKAFALWVIVLLISMSALGVSVANYIKTPVPTGTIITNTPPATNTTSGTAPIYLGTCNGFVIKFENGKIFYFSGDTCLFGDMKWVIHDYYHPDVAFLPAGNVFTMDEIDAAKATEWVDPQYVIPYHYRVFPFLEQNMTEFKTLVNDNRNHSATRAIPIVPTSGVPQLIDGVNVTWLGHGTFFFVSPNGTRILIDPWLTPNPDTPAFYKNMSHFGRVDLLLLTHGHIDHFDFDDMRNIIKLYNPAILSQWEMMTYFQSRIAGQYLMMNKGGRITKSIIEKQGFTVNMSDQIQITMVQAEHSSSY